MKSISILLGVLLLSRSAVSQSSKFCFRCASKVSPYLCFVRWHNIGSEASSRCHFVLSHHTLWLSTDITVCSEQGNATCVEAGNRICLKTDDVEECGNCRNEYLEYQEECLFIDDINFTLVIELIDEYAPQFTSNATLEVRLLRLEIVARVVSWFESQIPPIPFDLVLNKFSLDTEEEERQRTGYRYVPGLDDEFRRFDGTTSRRNLQDLPAKVDWVEAGAMTPVKDQGRCGCCWAVSTMATVESAAFLTPGSGFLQSLSFQQLVSCDKNNLGCNGGNIVSIAMRGLYMMEHSVRPMPFPLTTHVFLYYTHRFMPRAIP